MEDAAIILVLWMRRIYLQTLGVNRFSGVILEIKPYETFHA